MPEPTVADLKVTNALVTRQDSRSIEVTSDEFDGSNDMDTELRIIEPSIVPQEAEGASTDDAEEMTPQDLSVPRTQHTPSPITLSDTMSLKPKLDPTPVSRKRKSTSPSQDRRAKWAFSEAGETPVLHDDLFMLPKVNRNLEEKPLSNTEMNERFLLTNSTTLALQAVALANEMCQQQQQQQRSLDEELPVASKASHSEPNTPRILPQPPSSPPQTTQLPRPNGQDEDELTDLLAKLARAQDEFRSTFLEASGRYASSIEESVRTAFASFQAKHLATLSVSSAPPLPGLGPPLPQLADVNGNPALFNLKDMSKSVEQMLINHAFPYRLMAAAAAANRMVQPPLPYTPTTPTLLQTPMPPAFPVPTPISCSSINGEGSLGDDSDGDFNGDCSAINMSKKKRTKVTDNHLRNAFGGLQGIDAVTAATVFSPTLELLNSVAQSTAPVTPSVTSTNSFNATPTASLTNSPLRGPAANFNDLSNSTLTPVHLRKAKLMFFYTRYPNSNVLKVYFPDVRFNKHNTAQIVKWFSNFREFYYIQIEKFARQAIAEGVQEADEIAIMPECELIRTLNVHYNRNNQIQVPHHFVHIVGITVREFFKALITHKDQDHSWKKPIYKVIARYDQPVPEEFKNSNWIDHLES